MISDAKLQRLYGSEWFHMLFCILTYLFLNNEWSSHCSQHSWIQRTEASLIMVSPMITDTEPNLINCSAISFDNLVDASTKLCRHGLDYQNPLRQDSKSLLERRGDYNSRTKPQVSTCLSLPDSTRSWWTCSTSSCSSSRTGWMRRRHGSRGWGLNHWVPTWRMSSIKWKSTRCAAAGLDPWLN